MAISLKFDVISMEFDDESAKLFSRMKLKNVARFMRLKMLDFVLKPGGLNREPAIEIISELNLLF